MLLLFASLLFSPQYQVTRPAERVASLIAGAGGYAYVTSTDAQGDQLVSKVDPDGKLIYRVAPMASAGYPETLALDSAGCVYAAGIDSTGSPVLVKIDPTGKILSRRVVPTPVGVAVSGTPLVVAAPDGSAYLSGGPGWVTKLGANGTVYTTTVSSTSEASIPFSPDAIAADASGHVFVGGSTGDHNFPATPGALQTQCASTENCTFVMKLKPDLSGPEYTTFLPGNGTVTAMQLDAAGDALLTSSTPTAVTTALLSSTGDQLSQMVSTSLASLHSHSTSPLIVVPDGKNLLVTGSSGVKSFVAVVRAEDASLLYYNALPALLGGSGIASDGSGGFIVIGTDIGLLDASGNALFTPGQSWWTRFVPKTGPRPAILGVANLAAFEFSLGLAPGEKVNIYGQDLGPAKAAYGTYDSNGRLPSELVGTTVQFNGNPAPLLSVGSGLVSAIVPFEVNGDSVSVEISVNGQPSNTVSLPRTVIAPAIFQQQASMGQFGPASALNENGSVNSPANPAVVGSVVGIFLNGTGLLTSASSDGKRGVKGGQLELPVSIAMDGIGLNYTNPNFPPLPAEIVYAGQAPDLADGQVQVNFRVSGASTYGGATQVFVTIGDQQATAAIWSTLPPGSPQ